MALAPGCCHGVDLFTVRQPTDFKQHSTYFFFGCQCQCYHPKDTFPLGDLKIQLWLAVNK